MTIRCGRTALALVALALLVAAAARTLVTEPAQGVLAAVVITPRASDPRAIVAYTHGQSVTPPLTSELGQPDVPRGLRVTYGASWRGGDVTVRGLSISGQPISERFVDGCCTTGDPVERYGYKVFAEVTSVDWGTWANNSSDPKNFISVGTTDRLGLRDVSGNQLIPVGWAPDTSPGALFVSGAASLVGAKLDAFFYGAPEGYSFTPVAPEEPDGDRSYLFLVPGAHVHEIR